MDHVEKWKLKKRIEYLESVQPVQSKSIISLLIKPNDNIQRVRSFISEEISRAANIKSDLNRSSVIEGLRSIGEYLKTFTSIPANGIACYYGNSIIEPTTGKEKKLKVFFEPIGPISKFVYCSDVYANTETLKTILATPDNVGFIIIDGKGALFTDVSGTDIRVKCKMPVDLPRKHGRGGQSASRFARNREECRNQFIKLACHKATELFISNDKANISSIIIAGQAQLKDEFEKSDHFDQRLKQLVRLVVTVSYGEMSGLNEAIALSTDTLNNLRLNIETKVINEFFDLLSQGQEDLVCYGAKSTIEALEEGAVAKIIVYEELKIVRFNVRNVFSGKCQVYYCAEDKLPGEDIEILDSEPLIEWLAEHAVEYGCKLELVSDSSKEGTMLCQGFDGIIGLLRYSRVQYD